MVLSLFVLLLAQQAAPTMITIARGEFSGVEEAKDVFVRTPAAWGTLWKSHAGPQAAPAVEFATDAVAAVFLGFRPTGGYGVEIRGIRREGDTLIVDYVERRPGPGDIVTQVLTSPFHIVRVPQHAGPVRFQKGGP
ncbi:MAG: protease complex subunit PrcB family protein [Acidobacteria bacterium]|nr:protease complex subunit PrcB family protein [Acidobacteriota bacterium]